MLGYLVVIVLMTVWYMVCQKTNDKNHKNFLIGTTIIMILFYGLRGQNVGSDTISYIAMFNVDGAVPMGELWTYMWEQKSPAFVLFEWVFYQVLPYVQLWFIATSAFFFINLSRFIQKNSMIFFTILGLFQTTGVRQSCAMAILLIAYEQMKNKKLIRFILLVVLAYFFHKSSIVFLPFYLVGRRKITNADIPVLGLAVVLIYMNRADLFDNIKSFTSYDYFEHLNHAEPVNFSIMIFAFTIAALVLCAYLISREKKNVLKNLKGKQVIYNKGGFYAEKLTFTNRELKREIYKNKEISLYSQFANAMVLASLFVPFIAVNGAARRIVMYFALFMILLIPKAVNEFLDSHSAVVFKMGAGAVFTLLLVSGVSDSSYSYYMFFME